MTEKYKVDITYEEEQDPSTFNVYPDGRLEQLTGPPLKNATALLGDIVRVANWLKRNGGSKIEILEETT